MSQAPRSIRAILAELAEALIAGDRAGEAIVHLDQALREAGDDPPRGALQARLGEAAERAALSGTALRAYLEAFLAGAGGAADLLAAAHRVLTPAAASEHVAWIRGELAAGLASRSNGAEHAEALVLIACVTLALGDPEITAAHLEEAAAVDLDAARAAARARVFDRARWPALAAGTPRARLVAALLHRALGELDEARAEVSAALGGDLGRDRIAALLLHAELLAALGELEASAEPLLEAGRLTSRAGDTRRAATLFAQSAERNPRHAPAFWEWAEALRVLAAPEVDVALLREAVEAWSRGFAAAPPDPAHSWAYLSRALLAELEGRADPARETEHAWEAVARAESALVQRPRNAEAWGFLARALRGLSLNENAAWATEQGLAIDPDDLVALEERAAALANLGRFEGCAAAAARRLSIEPKAWVESVLIYAEIFLGRAAEAVRKIDRLLEGAAELDAYWYRELRAYARFRLDQIGPALDDVRWIWERREARVPPTKVTLAWAAYKLGEHAEAEARFRALLGDVTQTPGRVAQYLGLTLLATLRVEEGEAMLLAGIDALPGLGDLDQLVEWELPDLAALAARHPDRIGPVLARARERLAARRAALARQPTTAVSELEAQAERVDRAGSWASFEGVAVRAARARLAGAEGEQALAAALHAALLGERERFPVAPIAFREALEKLGDEAAARILGGDAAGALTEACLPALELARAHGSADQIAAIAARTGYARFRSGDREAALRELAESARAAGGAALGQALAALASDPAAYWELDDALREAASLSPDAAFAEAIPAARAALSRALDDWLGRVARADGRPRAAVDAGDLADPHAVLPIVVQMDESVIAPLAGAGSPLFERHLPELRDRLRSDLGLVVPGVRFRGDPSPPEPGAYVIMLHEATVAWGRVVPEKCFSPADPAALERAGVAFERGPVPGGDRDGGWIAPSDRDAVIAADLPLWPDGARYAVAHLEASLRRGPRAIFGVDEAAQAIAEWSRDPDLAARVGAWDEAARAQIARALRALVREGVPIGQGAPIVEAAAEIGLGEDLLEPLVSAVRARLARRLAGNEPGTRRVLLPEDVEARIAAGVVRERGRDALVLGPSAAGALLAELRALLAADAGDAPIALVVRRPEVRAAAWQVARLCDQRVPVLSQLEADRAAEGR